MTAWTMTVWPCVCGREHAPWWRTVPPPSCPNGWRRGLLDARLEAGAPSMLEALTFDAVMSVLGGPVSTEQP